MSYLSLQNVCKSYGSQSAATQVLENINLEIMEREFLAIVGFSGSGKTTLISLIAGLIQPDKGVIRKNGQPITGPGADRCVVFQTYSLMPWLTVHDNVMLAVEAVHPDWPKKRRQQFTQRYVEMVGLGHASHRRPAELSGGMRQRVNVARALAASPDILLLDEPLSALDALTRARLQDEITRIWEDDRKTVVLITNDVDEALIMADRVVPLNPGPGATFGPEFAVTLARPRDRQQLNTDGNFKTLRADITQYLIGVGVSNSARSDKVVELPNLRPQHSMAKSSRAEQLDPDLPSALAPFNAKTDDPRYLEFFKVTKIYPTPKGPLTVVDEFQLTMKKGEFISIIGHSGCGKSTVLSMTAGLNEISNGGIVLDGREVDSAGPDRAVVFQSPSLFPWMTARENVAMGVDGVYPHASAAERSDLVDYHLDKVGLGAAMHRRAADLSNGMKQRVGIARAFALSPKLLLLDEPFGMLDTLTRWELQEVLMEVWSRTQVTAIVVTHDVDEAILLADRVVMMTNGPHAKVGKVMEVDLPRPRTRKQLVSHPDYYRYREELIGFLADCDAGH